MIPFLATMRKEILLLMKDPGGLTMLFVLPSIFIIVLSTALQGAFSGGGKGETLDVLTVNKDKGPFGGVLIDMLEENAHFRPVARSDEAAAKAEVEAGRYPLLLVIPDGASDAVALRGEKQIRIVRDPAFSGEVTMALEGMVKELVHLTLLRNAYGMRDRSAASETPSDRAAPFTVALTVTTAVARRADHQEITPNAVQQNVPGWTIYALFWIAQLLAIGIIGERETGAFKRVMASPTGFGIYMLGKSAPYLFINVVQAVVLFLIGVYFLPVIGCPKLVVTNLPALALLTVAVSFTAIGFGLLMAAAARTTFVAASLSATILIVMTAVGGIMVPKFVMPSFMQKASLAVPQGWALDGYLDILVRGKGVADIATEIGVLLAFGTGFAVIGLVRMHRMNLS